MPSHAFGAIAQNQKTAVLRGRSIDARADSDYPRRTGCAVHLRTPWALLLHRRSLRTGRGADSGFQYFGPEKMVEHRTALTTIREDAAMRISKLEQALTQ